MNHLNFNKRTKIIKVRGFGHLSLPLLVHLQPWVVVALAGVSNRVFVGVEVSVVLISESSSPLAKYT